MKEDFLASVADSLKSIADVDTLLAAVAKELGLEQVAVVRWDAAAGGLVVGASLAADRGQSRTEGAVVDVPSEAIEEAWNHGNWPHVSTRAVHVQGSFPPAIRQTLLFPILDPEMGYTGSLREQQEFLLVCDVVQPEPPARCGPRPRITPERINLLHSMVLVQRQILLLRTREEQIRALLVSLATAWAVTSSHARKPGIELSAPSFAQWRRVTKTLVSENRSSVPIAGGFFAVLVFLGTILFRVPPGVAGMFAVTTVAALGVAFAMFWRGFAAPKGPWFRAGYFAAGFVLLFEAMKLFELVAMAVGQKP